MSNTKSESAKIALPLPNPHPVFALPHRPPPKVPEIVFGESKTEQCHKDSCDINLIVAGALHNPAQLLDKTLLAISAKDKVSEKSAKTSGLRVLSKS